MTAATTYTFEFYKVNSEGLKKIITKVDVDIEPGCLEFYIEGLHKAFPAKKGYSINAIETFIEKTSAMDGTKFMERYDTPYYCSPSSETYWSM